MFSIKALRFVRTLYILAAVLPVCGLQLYGQRSDPRMPLSEAARATAAKAETARAVNTAQVLPPPTAIGTFVTFDVPGAVNGTSPTSINNGGAITGGYGDNNGSGSHGFIRGADGSFVTFDVPGAVNGTFPSTINDGGDTAGYYFDNVGSGSHGFVRATNATFVTFDVPGGVNLVYFPSFINAKGEVAGTYFDANFVQHSFLREPNGSLTTIDPPLGRQRQRSFHNHPQWSHIGDLL